MTNAHLIKALRGESKHSRTSRVVVTCGEGTASIHLFEGRIYSVTVDGFRPQLTNRLAVAGVLTPDRLDVVDRVIPAADQDAGIGRFAVEEDWLTAEQLATFHAEYLLAALGAAVAAPDARVRTSEGETTSQLCVLPVDVEELLESVATREQQAARVWAGVAPDASPRETVLRVLNPDAGVVTASPELQSFLSAIDGIDTVEEIAGLCGFTRAEAIYLSAALILGGAVSVAGRKTVSGIHVPEDFAATTAA